MQYVILYTGRFYKYVYIYLFIFPQEETEGQQLWIYRALPGGGDGGGHCKGRRRLAGQFQEG